jgi:polysaccharide export outer membrane protein
VTAHHLALLAAFIVAAAHPAAAQQQPAPATEDSALSVDLDPSLRSAVPDTEWTRWTSGRYRVTPGDVLELTFPFVSELNQTVTVQPDGYITLKEIPDIRVQGRTVAQVKADVLAAYEPFVREPVLAVTLKEFEKPYFVANGEVEKPGRYELRGATTLTQALAFAGGPTDDGNISRVILFRRYGEDGVDVKEINVKRLYAKRDLTEDPLLRPGDMILVPKSVVGKLAPLLDVLRWRR